MGNAEIAALLREVAASYAIKDDKRFRFQITAYQKAADSIDQLSTEIKDLLTEGKLQKIPSIGPTLTSYIEELFKKGKVDHFESVMREIPSSVFPLLNIPGFGPKKAYKIVKALHLKNPATAIGDLEQCARLGKIASIPTFGDKSQEDILRAIDEYKTGKTKSSRMVLPYAATLAQKMVSYLKKSKDVIEAYPLGSLRRMVETIGDIDIAVATKKPKSVIDYFINYPNKERIIEKGDKTASILLGGGRQVDLMVQNPDGFGSLLQHFTGSKQHNILLREYALKKGMSLSEYGIKEVKKKKSRLRMFSNEQDFYRYLGLEFIPPELREGRNEIDLAQKHALPKLVNLTDIKGDLHIHSHYQIEPSHDLGTDSFEQIIKTANKLHYEYIGFSEHNPSIGNHTKTQIISILKRRKQIIDQLIMSNKSIRIVNLLEVDILTNGDIAIPNEGSSYLDAFLVSIHSSFGMNKEQMATRIIKGLTHPKAKILSHPTGRLLGARAGYETNWNEIFAFMKKHKKALEINAWPTRLDLPEALVMKAKEFGLKFMINTDSHEVSQMDNMPYGVAVARRAGCVKEDILNCLPYKDFISWLKG